MKVRRITNSLLRSAAGAGLLALCLGFSIPAIAQTDRGTITGTVTDPAGAVVPGAAITALNKATGSTITTVTTSTGNYTLPTLPSGIYDLQSKPKGSTDIFRKESTFRWRRRRVSTSL